MNAAQRNRHAAQLKSTGYEDGPALTVQSTDGEIPQGRELSFAWLAGTVLTGLTSVLLMGAALYVSFQGQDTFSTAYEALHIGISEPAPSTDVTIKTDRVRPVAATRSESEIVEASIRETADGRVMIRKQPFARISATLATAATSLSDDIPDYDVSKMLEAGAPSGSDAVDPSVNTDIYGAEVEGEVAVKVGALSPTLIPASTITDNSASQFVRIAVEGGFSEQDSSVFAYADEPGDVRDLSFGVGSVVNGIAENVTVVPKSTMAEGAGPGRSERILTLKDTSPLEDVLIKNGFTQAMIGAISGTLRTVYPSTRLIVGTRLRILFGPSRNSNSLIPYRLSIYMHDAAANTDRHAATVALTDKGQYVLATQPPQIVFPEEDTEEVNVSNLPSIYRSIWETARKHDIGDEVTMRILAMFASDVDLTKKVTPGDLIQILETEPDAEGRQELLYVGLTLGATQREMFRFRSEDGKVDFFDPSGDAGKRFLNRRPVKGGGRLASRFGWRNHPIFKSRKLHTGVDFASPAGTPIYAAGDGVVEKAGWTSGYGRYTLIQHVNGYETGYGHQSKISVKPGQKVRQGQVIGYVGSTGNSTGNHLHFEIKINNRFVDPLSVKLPRDKSLPVQSEKAFAQTVEQIRDLITRNASGPVTVASN